MWLTLVSYAVNMSGIRDYVAAESGDGDGCSCLKGCQGSQGCCHLTSAQELRLV